MDGAYKCRVKVYPTYRSRDAVRVRENFDTDIAYRHHFCYLFDMRFGRLDKWKKIKKIKQTRGRSYFTKHKPHAARRKGLKYRFCPWWPLTFHIDLQTCPSEGPNTLPCEFGANPFSSSRYFIHKQKVTDSTKNRTLRSSLRAAVKMDVRIPVSIFPMLMKSKMKVNVDKETNKHTYTNKWTKYIQTTRTTIVTAVQMSSVQFDVQFSRRPKTSPWC